MNRKKPNRSSRKSRDDTRERILKAAAAHAATIDARLSQRSSETVKIDTAIPASALAFLENLYHEPPLKVPDGKDFWADYQRVALIIAAMRDAYRQGCRQGFIEGFVARRMPDKKRSATANAGKRKALVVLPDGRKMTRDDRDTLMVEEFEALLALRVKKTPAMQRLAEKYGFESWQGVAAAIESFRERSDG